MSRGDEVAKMLKEFGTVLASEQVSGVCREAVLWVKILFSDQMNRPTFVNLIQVEKLQLELDLKAGSREVLETRVAKAHVSKRDNGVQNKAVEEWKTAVEERLRELTAAIKTLQPPPSPPKWLGLSPFCSL